ncbi:Pentatricopeptide repeat-containing protein [Forsythia ovata]|uniref:Pentatricopeptide repeat-containing protein n=1 Tax=Forsythia ovata TaxID=205694 RepID=A0ABD1VJM1_9LAMI
MAFSQSIVCVNNRRLFSTLFLFSKFHPYSSSAPQISDDVLVSAAVSILKHHRSKSRWSHLRSLLSATSNLLSPSQFSRIALENRNNPHLALRFFHFTVRNTLCCHSLLSYATIIHILCHSRLKTEAQSLIRLAFRKFPEASQPSSSSPPPIFEILIKTYRTCGSAPFVFDILVKACLESKKIDQALGIFRMLKSKNVFLRTSTCNSLIELVSKSRGCFAAYDLYREIFYFGGENGVYNRRGVKDFFPNVNTFNVLMVAFYRERLVENVEEVWKEMGRVVCMPNSYSYSVLMAVYCGNARMEDAMRVWEEMQNKGVKPDAVAYNTLIDGFCGTGEIVRAEEIYREMVMSGVESTCVTFEHLINGYCKIGDADTAMLLYKNMCREGFHPDSSMVDAVIRVLCDKGDVSSALDVLMVLSRKHDVIPKKESYRVLIKCLCQEGKMEEALRLQAEMVGKGYEPDSETYGAFIDGYLKQGNESMAGKLRKEMLNK